MNRSAQPVVLAALLLALLLAGCTSRPWPALRLAAVDPDGRIVVIGGNGQLTALTEAGSRYRRPVPSPDGRRLAFMDDTGTAIFMASAGGEWVHEVYRSDEERPLAMGWSPDGAYLIFSSNSAVAGVRLLHQIAADTGDVRTLDAGPDLRWHWRGNDLLITAGPRQTHMTTGGQVLAEEDSIPAAATAPRPAGAVDVPSPNGLRVARFTPQADGSTLLSFANPHTGLFAGEVRLTLAPAYWSLLQEIDLWQGNLHLWSPDGRYLVVSQADAGGPTLWIHPTAGKLPPERLAPGVEASWFWR